MRGESQAVLPVQRPVAARPEGTKRCGSLPHPMDRFRPKLRSVNFFRHFHCENKDNPLLVNLIKAGTVNEIVLFFPKFIVDELLEKYRTTMGV